MVAGDRDAGGGGVDAGMAVRWDQLSAAAFPIAAVIDTTMENQREQVSTIERSEALLIASWNYIMMAMVMFQ